MDRPYLTIEEAAEYVNVAVSTIYKNWKSGKFPAPREGRPLTWTKSDLDHFRRPRSSVASLTKFQEVRERLRSLKTEVTTQATPQSFQKGAG